jgi:hypothetical protein
MAKVYYVGDWAVLTGPVFAETPFHYSHEGLDIFNYGIWLRAYPITIPDAIILATARGCRLSEEVQGWTNMTTEWHANGGCRTRCGNESGRCCRGCGSTPRVAGPRSGGLPSFHAGWRDRVNAINRRSESPRTSRCQRSSPARDRFMVDPIPAHFVAEYVCRATGRGITSPPWTRPCCWCSPLSTWA